MLNPSNFTEENTLEVLSKISLLFNHIYWGDEHTLSKFWNHVPETDILVLKVLLTERKGDYISIAKVEHFCIDVF